ncbi:hypothetical protein GSI_14534 [Ganoderma sinense ZZ0214-1]|uniref:Heterokaryon incompatibility domain-containing protein n=1 Tax=Ganoderma sinense ZZ0214-1 TaxID=1077348 RepID=A0A2G8RNX8_9APHY|nr:hypothetical protein GSI_14534 [Ganoderma sinense ZZ0214-1]
MSALRELWLTILLWFHRLTRHPNQSTVCSYCATGPLSPSSWTAMMGDKSAVAYRTTRTRLLAGENGGCHLCRLLVVLGVGEGPEAEVIFQVDQDPDNPVDEPMDTQYLLIHARVDGCRDKFRTYCVYTSVDDLAADEIVCKAPTLRVDSPQARMLALERIKDCVDNHDTCLKPKKTRLPTRVIDCRVPTEPRLVLSESLENVFVPYVALSYVWGKDDTHCTRLANYEAYQAGIDYGIIPQTIRDAITVTNGLDMRYIWIDAFCIIQDSDEDKIKELVKMGDIYRDAYFTVIASSSPEGNAGFLQDRVLPPHWRVPFYRRDGRLGTVCIGQRGETVPSSVAGREPVDRRAWCFQEWLLSPRKLMYTTDTLRYHCQTSARPVENSIRALRTVQSSTLDHAFLPLPLATLANPDLATLSSEELFARQCMLWGLVVANYTQRSLSWKTDKLLAFSAIAEQFDSIWEAAWRPGRYIAGLWEGFLPRDLLWRRQIYAPPGSEDDLRPRPAEYLAPSWAWPSVDGHVVVGGGAAYSPGECIVDVCDVLECDVKLLDERLPYGRVTAGHLRVRAVVAPGWVVVEPPNLKPRSDYVDTHYYKLYGPTAELRSRLAGLSAASDDGVTVGEALFDGPEEMGVPVVVPAHFTRTDGRLLVVGQGVFRKDDALVQRLGQCDIYFDGTERVDVEDSWLVLINRGERRDRVTGEGLVVTSAGEGKFRRIGFWSLMLEVNNAVPADVPTWTKADAEKAVIDLV